MQETKTKRCPFCGEEILATARKCKHCKEWVENNNQEYQKVFNKNVDIYVWVTTLIIVLCIPMTFGMACVLGFLGGTIGLIIKMAYQNNNFR